MASSDALMARFLALHPRTIDLSLGRIERPVVLDPTAARPAARRFFMAGSPPACAALSPRSPV